MGQVWQLYAGVYGVLCVVLYIFVLIFFWGYRTSGAVAELSDLFSLSVTYQ